MKKRHVGPGLAVIFFILSLSLIFSCTRKEESVKIGVAGPMTGDQSKMGIDVKNGAELAVREWNERGGVLGKKIDLLDEDDQHDPKQAVSVANKLVNDGIAGMIGHFNSSASIPASSVYNKANIPMITPASTNPQLTEQGFTNVFRVCGRDDQQGLVAATFVADMLKLKKVAVLHDKTTYGQGLADEFVKALGSRVAVVDYNGISQEDKDFRAVLTALKGKGAELLYFGGIYPQGGLIIKQARELGIHIPFMSGDGVIDQKFVEIAGPASEGSYLTFSPDPEHLESAKDFLKSYKAGYGEPGPYSIYAYDAANVMLRAIETAKTTEGTAVSRAIHEMKHTGAVGGLQWDEKGDVLRSPYVVWITKSGKFKEHWKPGEAAP
ncbi:MAG TPA: branched-chain amino acid ABC transporter substrate-binding protein [Nitrospirota bacterium]|nr:branched-chain amino acid ABC transporter substrate-binding protein [Nitrospirota bacterium]